MHRKNELGDKSRQCQIFLQAASTTEREIS